MMVLIEINDKTDKVYINILNQVPNKFNKMILIVLR